MNTTKHGNAKFNVHNFNLVRATYLAYRSHSLHHSGNDDNSEIMHANNSNNVTLMATRVRNAEKVPTITYMHLFMCRTIHALIWKETKATREKSMLKCSVDHDDQDQPNLTG